MEKLAIIILDGFGINTKTPKENAIVQAKAPLFHKLFKEPFASLAASGKAVGVPEGHIGDSEIGHLTIGSWRIIKQSIVEIDDMLDDGSFKKIPEFQAGIEHCKKRNSNLHLIQIFGPGGVHGYDSHLRKILKLIPKEINVNLHLFTDGRDLDPKGAYDLMVVFEKYLEKFPNVKISSLGGRYYGMDRDNNRGRIQKAYDEIVFGQIQTSDSPSEYIRKSYEKLIDDEFILPVCFTDGDQIEDDDTIFHLNFRSDRGREMTQALMASIHPDDAKKHTKRSKNFLTKTLRNVYFATMTLYYPEYDGPVFVKHEEVKNTLGEVISHNEMRQFHLAETEKFAHVTKFFNGDKQIVYDGEKDILVPSKKVATYDLAPEVSSQEIYDEFVRHANNFDFVVVNYANGDLVGHTWFMNAAIKTVEKLDQLIWLMIEFCKKNKFELIVTADHGNCEEMWTPAKPMTAHTLNPVPCRFIENWKVQKIAKKWWLSDIAPTVLKIMWIKTPKEMTGKSLV